MDEKVKIENKIHEISNEMKKHYRGGVIQHSLLSDLFSWLDDNGKCVFINKKIKELKTQDNIIETYIAKYGIKFQIIFCYKKDIHSKCIDLRIKVL